MLDIEKFLKKHDEKGVRILIYRNIKGEYVASFDASGQEETAPENRGRGETMLQAMQDLESNLRSKESDIKAWEL